MPFCAYCGTPVTAVSYAPCPSCGSPTNGAPRPTAVASSGSNAAILTIVIVGVILVVVAIVGILAAIAIPNLLTATQRSKQKRTMADLRSIAVAVEGYASDHKAYPDVKDVAALSGVLVPTYIRTVPLLDGWGHPMRYESWSSDGQRIDAYAVGSAGKDGSFSRASLREYQSAATTNFNEDIVFSMGSFVLYPEGLQVQ
jgi:general secretion pathway protein G